MPEYSIKETWKRFKLLMKNKSFAYVVYGGIGLYVYIIGIIAYSMDNKISFNPFKAIIGLLFNSKKGLVLLIALGIAFSIATLIFFKMNEEDLFDERGFKKSNTGTYGTSDWMSRAEIDQALEVNTVENTTGIILGKLDPDPTEPGKFATEAHQIVSLPPHSGLNKHVAVYGGSGSRKSRSFVRPQIIQSALKGESVIITDPKGEMYADTAVYLEEKGYDVKVFNLVNPEYSDSWNSLGEITKDPEQVEVMAQTFADVIISNTETGDGFWDTSEMNLLKALSLLVALDPFMEPEDKNIGAVYDHIAESDPEKLNALFEGLPPGHPAKQPWGIFQKSGENVQGNVMAGLGIKLQVLQSEVIRNIASVDDIDLEAPGLKKTAIFVIMSDQDNTLTFMSSLFFAFLFIRLVRLADARGGACPVPVNFILDEFPNIGQIPDFTKKISTIRSRELRVAVIFQNLPQMQNRYPDNAWKEIIGNCDTTLFLGCNDDTTAEFVSARTGQMTIEVDSKRVNKKAGYMEYGGSQDYAESSSYGKREVMTPDEVMRMEPNEALVILRGEKPLKVNKFDYSLHPESKKFKFKLATENKPRWKKDYIPTYDTSYLYEENKKKEKALDEHYGRSIKEDDVKSDSSGAIDPNAILNSINNTNAVKDNNAQFCSMDDQVDKDNNVDDTDVNSLLDLIAAKDEEEDEIIDAFNDNEDEAINIDINSLDEDDEENNNSDDIFDILEEIDLEEVDDLSDF